VSGKQNLPRQSRWPGLPEQGCPLPSHDLPGCLRKVVWRLRNCRATKFPLRHTVGSRVGDQFAIDTCALMHAEKGSGLACKRIFDGGAKGRVQASSGQSRSRSWRWFGGVQRWAVGTVGSCDGLWERCEREWCSNYTSQELELLIKLKYRVIGTKLVNWYTDWETVSRIATFGKCQPYRGRVAARVL